MPTSGEDDNLTTAHRRTASGYGDGGVDDLTTARIVVHEYGHAIHKRHRAWFRVYSGESVAISEGFGDYSAPPGQQRAGGRV
ncbi:MAG: hypothetical protein IPP62_16180 [bacterium]|nr:hypothetical protein [bacterium]